MKSLTNEETELKHSVINNEIFVTLPDRFTIMDRSQLEKYFRSSKNRWGIMSDEHRIMIYVGWTGENVLLDLFADTQRVLRSAVSRARRHMSGYTMIKTMRSNICGSKADGVRFEYTAPDSPDRQLGEIVAVKLGRRYYIMACTGRSEESFLCRQIFHGLITSMHIK